jgi:transposase-like protein
MKKYLLVILLATSAPAQAIDFSGLVIGAAIGIIADRHGIVEKLNHALKKWVRTWAYHDSETTTIKKVETTKKVHTS